MSFIEQARESRSYVYTKDRILGVVGFIPGHTDGEYVFRNFWRNTWVHVEDVFQTREEAENASGFARYA